MGNEQSTFADIPVYYRPGHGVSLYKPAEKLHIFASDGSSIRKRKNGNNNGEVTNSQTEELKFSDDNSFGDQPGVPHRNHALDFRDLRLEIDESGFIEDENDVDINPPSLSNSLKGNFSPRSLYEKSRQYDNLTSTHGSDGECACLKDNSSIHKSGNENKFDFANVDHNGNGKSNKVLPGNEIKDNLNKPDYNNLTQNGNLESSSVLLTPPPEDELSSSGQPPPTSSAGISLHSTKSEVSDIHSEVADPFSDNVNDDREVVDGGALTDEDQENFSPLPLDLTSERSPEKRLHIKALILKLNELKSRSRHNSDSSPKSPTLNTCLEHRRVSSLGSSKETTYSGISSPELELLNSETKSSVVTSDTFDNLEYEIHEVEDEFMTISSQLQELTDKCSNCDTCTNAGLEIIDGIYRRYPSIRVRHRNKEVQNANFKFSNLSELETNHESDLETDGADLSWDLDNVLDMLYSETSDPGSMQNPLVKKLSDGQVEWSEDCNPIDFIEENSFNSSVELDGSLYEDDFHLQLGKSIKVYKMNIVIILKHHTPSSKMAYAVQTQIRLEQSDQGLYSLPFHQVVCERKKR